MDEMDEEDLVGVGLGSEGGNEQVTLPQSTQKIRMRGGQLQK